jgi:hypothetical protein
VLVLVAFAAPAGAGEAAAPEYKVKAGYLYNFGKFVEWPAAARSKTTFRIGIVDDGKVFASMEAVLQGKKVSGRTIELLHNPPDDEMKTCHILFIARSANKRAGSILGALGTAPVLTVGEFDRFAHNGGRINFVVKEDSVRLEINLAAAEAAGLKISSELASLATVVSSEK